MGEHDDELARIRLALEAADQALVAALDARARAVKDVVALRARDREGYYALPRDQEIVDRVKSLAREFPLPALEPVLREILSACASITAKVQVVYLGPEGGLAHVAARRHFGASAELRPVDGVGAVVEEVARARANFGIVPLETSSDGAVTATLDALASTEVKICAELTLPVRYHLMSKTGNVTDIEKIYASSAAIGACERYLRTQFPRAMVMDVPSSAMGAQLASGDHGAAAVGTEVVAELAGLRIIRESIQDETGVETRFAVIGSELPARTGTDRTVLALAVHDKPGALLKALGPFAERSVNLTRLESRPAHGAAWRYLFFVELDGHVTDRNILTAIEELRSVSRHVKILGSYPRPA